MMRRYLYVILHLSYFTPLCGQGLTDTDILVIGDINNDKIVDTAFVTGPKWLNDEDGWGDPKIQPYEIKVSFSNGLSPIYNYNAVMGEVENIGDVDGDGISEVIVVPIWFIGCWGRMEFYTYKERQWRNFGQAGCHICTEDEKFSDNITVVGKGRLRVLEYVWDEDAADRVKKPKKLRLSDWRKLSPQNN